MSDISLSLLITGSAIFRGQAVDFGKLSDSHWQHREYHNHDNNKHEPAVTKRWEDITVSYSGHRHYHVISHVQEDIKLQSLYVTVVIPAIFVFIAHSGLFHLTEGHIIVSLFTSKWLQPLMLCIV